MKVGDKCGHDHEVEIAIKKCDSETPEDISDDEETGTKNDEPSVDTPHI